MQNINQFNIFLYKNGIAFTHFCFLCFYFHSKLKKKINIHKIKKKSFKMINKKKDKKLTGITFKK